MTTETRFVELIAKQDEPGGYEILVFKDKDKPEYVMCTKLPNWNTKTPDISEEGYLQVREFIAGDDTWYDFNTGQAVPYRYTAIYFWNFIAKKEQVEEYKLD